MWKDEIELHRSKEENDGCRGQEDGATGRHWPEGRKLLSSRMNRSGDLMCSVMTIVTHAGLHLDVCRESRLWGPSPHMQERELCEEVVGIRLTVVIFSLLYVCQNVMWYILNIRNFS